MIFDKLVWHWIVCYDYYNGKLIFMQIRFKRCLLTIRMSDNITESDYYYIYLDNANSIVKMVTIFTSMRFLIDKDIQIVNFNDTLLLRINVFLKTINQ